ncbi:MAG: hypothetical protein LBF15_02740 [Candidatus Peribacteria bacterium]|nr:hypothetical protein [Candidatus Peribacteria bacterium]
MDIDDDLDEEKIEFFLKSFTKVPEENLVIFSYINPDKRTKFFKELEKVAEKREFIVGENNIFSTLQKKYANKISPSAISLLLRYKANSLEKIVNEIEKLSILYPFIDEKEVKENIVPELEESIFQVIDDILNEKIKEAIEKIITITNEINIYAFYNNLLANLRVSVFIMKLKKEGKNSVEI